MIAPMNACWSTLLEEARDDKTMRENIFEILKIVRNDKMK